MNTVITINNYITTKFFIEVHFLLNQKYLNFIISIRKLLSEWILGIINNWTWQPWNPETKNHEYIAIQKISTHLTYNYVILFLYKTAKCWIYQLIYLSIVDNVLINQPPYCHNWMNYTDLYPHLYCSNLCITNGRLFCACSGMICRFALDKIQY